MTTTMPANPIPLTVSQEARKAAADLAAARRWWTLPYREMVLRGELDSDAIIQAFARFEADCAARFVEKLEGLKRKGPPPPGLLGASIERRNSTLDEAITAIQEPRP